ncbi:MAG TPA: RHS repeat-associated core domain-containing protein [Candidatus Dormibacteraeota bacterium]|jgi:RHS repeat-associated protein|nr:RHS repeat-associated core domain-containing protein [Candidatus Dormibacteraeota bacterium]
MSASVVIGVLPFALGSTVATATGSASQLVFTTQPGDGAPAGALAAQPKVTIEDSSNATVSTSSTVTLTLTGPGGAALTGLVPTLTCAQTSGGVTSVSAGGGVATFSACSVSRGGLYTFTATDTTDSLTKVSQQFFVSGPAQLAFTAQPGGGAAATAWSNQPQVTVQDAHGVTVGGSTASIGLAIASGTGTSGATLACTHNHVAASSGIAGFAGCAVDKVGSGYALVATDSTDGLLSPSSSTFAVTSGTAAALVFTTQPSGGGGGAAFATQPAVTVQDAGGNTVSGNTDQITLSIATGTGTTGAHLACTNLSVAAVAGVATFAGCAVDLSGSGYKLSATDSTASLSASSAPFGISAGSAAHVAFSTQPGGGAGGAAFGTQPAVTLTDSGNNPVAGSVTLAIKSGTGTAGAHLVCTTNPMAVAAGVATFGGCSVDQTGTGYKLTATSGALSADSAAFDVSGGTAAKATFTTQPVSSTGGAAFSSQPVVKLTDAGNNPAAGAVTLSITTGSGTPGAALSCAQNPVTAVGGSASFSGCAVDRVGSGYMLTATSGSAGGQSTSFAITIGPAARLAFTTQPGGGTGGTAWAVQPIVAVQDAGGNQLPSSTASIALSVSTGTGAGTLACAGNPLPAVSGAALFAGCAIDRAASAYTLTAQDAPDGLSTTSAAFAVTVGALSRLVFSTQPGGAAAGIVFPTQPVVSVVDAGGNTVAGSSASIALALTPGTGAAGAAMACTASSLSASAGVAAFAGCSVNRTAGGYTMTARDTGDNLSVESLPFAILAPPPQPLGVAPTGVPLAQTFGGRVYGANPTSVVDSVNSATGALSFGVTDLRVAGIGEPLTLQRAYNSDDTTGGSFGPGWTSLLDVSVKIVQYRTATVRGEDGQQLVFAWNPRGGGEGGGWGGWGWQAPPGARAALSCEDWGCSLTRFDGVRIDFPLGAGGAGRIASYVARDGQGLRFNWLPGKVVITVATTNPAPYNVTALLNGAGQVTKVTTPANRTVSYAYATAGGPLTAVTDVRGSTWTYAYSANRLTGETDPLGHVRLSAGYDAVSGRVTSVSAQGGPQHTSDTFAWNAATQTSTRLALANAGGVLVQEAYVDRYLNNVLVAQTQPSGAITRYSYDAQVNLVEMQDPMGWVQQLAYDGANNLVSQSTPITSTSSATVRMTYDEVHRVTSQTDADGNTTFYVYWGPFLTFIRPPGAERNLGTALQYNWAGELVEVDSGIGGQTFSYDAAGNQTRVLLVGPQGQDQPGPPGQPLNGKGTLSTYDEAGNLLSSVDPRGTTTGPASAFTTARTYDAAGNVLATTRPGPQTTINTYDAAGDLVGIVDASGHTTSYAWNESALTRVTNLPGGGTATQSYDPSGNVLVETSAANRTTTHVYDAAGREVQTTDPANVTVRYTFDIESNVVAVADSAGNTLTRELDSLNRQVRQVSNGAVTLSGYDAAGNAVSTTDPAGSVTTTTYTPRGMPASVTNAAGTTTYRYDTADNLLSRTDANGHATTFGYDAASRQTSMSVGAATTSYAYDIAGNLTKVTDPDGRTTTSTLDALNRPTTTAYTWAAHPSITVTQQYDALGRRVKMVDSTGTHTYGYDASGNLTSVTTGADTFSYDYTHPGKIVETYPDGTVMTYAIDDALNLMSMQVGQQGNPGYVAASYMRNAQRQKTGVALSNGVLETRQLDQTGNVLDQALQVAGTKLADNAFTYDAAQNRLTQVDNVGGTATSNQYGYDATNRLTAFSSSTGLAPLLASGAPVTLAPAAPGASPASSVAPAAFRPSTATAVAGPSGVAVKPAVAPAYTYDGAGNQRTAVSGAGTTTSAYNVADQVTSQSGPGGATTWQYDRNGDVTQITRPGSTQTFTYDAAARLVGVTTTPGMAVTYTYDGDGNRVTKTAGASVTQYVWDTAGAYPHLAIERTGTGTLIRRYLYGDGLVALQTPAQTYFAHLDPQGSVAELSDSTGAIVAAYHYDGFGNVTTVGAGAPANPMLFQGQYLDSDTGLYNMRARNYDAASGRFTQRDPVSTPLGAPVVSPYVFAADRPTVLTDPTGKTAVTTTDVFWSHNSVEANVGADVKYAVAAIRVGIKVIPKIAPYIVRAYRAIAGTVTGEIAANTGKIAGATGEVATEVRSAGGVLGEAGSEIGPATKALSGASKVAKFAGVGLAIIGIGLQTFVSVEDCMHASVSQCVGDVVGLAVNIAFTIGCAVLTAGTAAFLCAVGGALLSLALQEVISRFGPQIADGVVSLYNDAAAGIGIALPVIVGALTTTVNVIASSFTTVGGVIATGFNKATAAISSGFQSALTTLVNAGYSAAQLGIVLAGTFRDGVNAAMSALAGLGYSINDIAQAVATVFSTTAAQAAQFFKDGFNYSVSQIAGALKSVYNLGDQAAALILKGINFAVDEVGTALKNVYGDAASAVASVLKNINYGVQQIGAALQQVFSQADQAVAQTLRALGYTVDQVGTALVNLYNDADQAVAGALKFAGFAVTEIGTALHDVFNDAAQTAASVLKTAGFIADEVGNALKSAYNFLDQGTAQVLESIGFAVNDVATALKNVFGDADQAVGNVLRTIGNTVGDVATALKTVFSDADTAVASVLKGAGFAVGEVATALKNVFSEADAAVASVLKGALFTAGEIGTALQSVFSDTAHAAAQVLKNLTYDVVAVGGVLQSVFGLAAADAASALNGVFSAADIAKALKDVFGQAAAAAAKILKDIGIAAADIAGALSSIFSQATSDIANLLSNLGFSSSTISAIGGAFTSFGQSVSDCFTSFFSNC